MTSNSEEPAHGDSFERRLAAFDLHKDGIIAILQKASAGLSPSIKTVRGAASEFTLGVI